MYRVVLCFSVSKYRNLRWFMEDKRYLWCREETAIRRSRSERDLI